MLVGPVVVVSVATTVLLVWLLVVPVGSVTITVGTVAEVLVVSTVAVVEVVVAAPVEVVVGGTSVALLLMADVRLPRIDVRVFWIPADVVADSTVVMAGVVPPVTDEGVTVFCVEVVAVVSAAEVVA